MSDRIILLGNEDGLPVYANAINKVYTGGNAVILTWNDPAVSNFEKLIGPKLIDKLFLVGHSNALGIGDYPYQKLVSTFGAHIKAATTVYLAGCNTGDPRAQILPGGFVAATLTENVQKFADEPVKGKVKVLGTPGPLALRNGELTILNPPIVLNSNVLKGELFFPVEMLK